MPPENVLGEEERECVMLSCCAQKARNPYHIPQFLHTWWHTLAHLDAALSAMVVGAVEMLQRRRRESNIFEFSHIFGKSYYIVKINLEKIKE